MRWLLLVPGALLVGGAVFDALQTTLGRGSGPLTSRVGQALHAVLMRHRGGGVSLKVFEQVGLAVLLAAAAMWVAMLWAGWTLVFSADPGSVVRNDAEGAPGTLPDRVYFVGYTLFTLGIGDLRPEGGVWQFATAIASLSGLFLITLSITYFIPVLQAAVERRALATYVSGLGRTPAEIVRNTWRPHEGDASLADHLETLTPALFLMAQRHKAYPALHYFHGSDRAEAMAPSLAALDEAVTLVQDGLAAEHGLPRGVVRPFRAALTGILGTLADVFIEPAAAPLPEPDPAALARDGGYRFADAAAFRGALGAGECAERRALLRALVDGEGWSWGHVTGAAAEDEG